MWNDLLSSLAPNMGPCAISILNRLKCFYNSKSVLQLEFQVMYVVFHILSNLWPDQTEWVGCSGSGSSKFLRGTKNLGLPLENFLPILFTASGQFCYYLYGENTCSLFGTYLKFQNLCLMLYVYYFCSNSLVCHIYQNCRNGQYPPLLFDQPHLLLHSNQCLEELAVAIGLKCDFPLIRLTLDNNWCIISYQILWWTHSLAQLYCCSSWVMLQILLKQMFFS